MHLQCSTQFKQSFSLTLQMPNLWSHHQSQLSEARLPQCKVGTESPISPDPSLFCVDSLFSWVAKTIARPKHLSPWSLNLPFKYIITSWFLYPLLLGAPLPLGALRVRVVCLCMVNPALLSVNMTFARRRVRFQCNLETKVTQKIKRNNLFWISDAKEVDMLNGLLLQTRRSRVHLQYLRQFHQAGWQHDFAGKGSLDSDILLFQCHDFIAVTVSLKAASFQQLLTYN